VGGDPGGDPRSGGGVPANADTAWSRSIADTDSDAARRGRSEGEGESEGDPPSQAGSPAAFATREGGTRKAPRAGGAFEEGRKRAIGRMLSAGAGAGWLRGQDLNLRPSGYEPDELPGCSTPRQSNASSRMRRENSRDNVNGFRKSALSAAPAAKPGDDLLFHRLSDSTIGAVWFHGRVRDGIGWVTDAMVTKL